MNRRNTQRRKEGIDRKKRIENRKKGMIPQKFVLPLLVVGIVILTILLLNLFTTSVNRTSNPSGESQESSEVSTTDTMKTEEKFEKINAMISNKNSDFQTRIEEYLVSNGLDKDNINLTFYSVEDRNYYTYGVQEKIPMRKYNYFIIGMLATDLAREEVLDLNEMIEIEKASDNKEANNEETLDETQNEQANTSTKLQLRQALQIMIQEKSDEETQAVINTIEEKTQKKWIDLANEKYVLNIDEENQMTKDDIAKILRRLLHKVDNTYIYQDVIANMIQNAENRDEFFSLNNNYFIGVEGRSIYQYSIENGFVLGKNNFIYSIQTNYSDKNIVNNLRKIIFEWFEDYR